MSIENVITIRDLYFSWEDRVIFSGVNIDIQRGKITAIIGPSGTGKTTLLKLIGGLLYPVKGTIDVNGENIHRVSRKRLYELRQGMGMLFQNGALLNLTAFENVAFPIREHTSLPEAEIDRIVSEKLDAVGLLDAKDCDANELSGGMARRVALARAMALNPQFMMYDEPFVGLDPIALNTIATLIRVVNDRFDMTSVIVSHDVEETFHIADYVYMIQNGKVVAEGTPQMLRSHVDDNVREFIQGVTSGTNSHHKKTESPIRA